MSSGSPPPEQPAAEHARLCALRRLAVYGSLAPGQINHHVIAGIRGAWRTGVVEGDLYERAWGAAMSYPGIILRADGPVVRVQVLESPDLCAHWERLDCFEGEGYRRVTTIVRLDDGRTVEAQIYALADATTTTNAARQRGSDHGAGGGGEAGRLPADAG